jgi:hypothetical protein
MYLSPLLARTSLLACLAFASSAASAHDVAKDFNLTANPNGVWTYGSAPGIGKAPTLFSKHATGPLEPGAGAVSYWNTGAASWDAYHGVFANQTTAPVTVSAGLVVAPGVLVLHPSNRGDFAVARFTVPADGTYDISAVFQAIDAQAKKTDAAVLLDLKPVCEQRATAKLKLTCDKKAMSLRKGQTLDFVVGNGGDGFGDDSVQLTASVTAAAPDLTGWFRLKTQFRGEGECLEGNQGSSPVHGGAAFMDSCQGVSGQLWKFVPAGGEWYKLKTQFRGEGECLEGNQGASPVHAGSAFMDTCQNVSGQLWKLEAAGGGWYKLKTQFRGEGECLEGN